MLKTLKQITAATVIGGAVVVTVAGAAAAQGAGGAYRWHERAPTVPTPPDAVKESEVDRIIADHPKAVSRHLSPEVRGLAQPTETEETPEIIGEHPNEIYRSQSRERELRNDD